MDYSTYMLAQLKALMDIPSPTGMTGEAAAYVHRTLSDMGFHPAWDHKGSVICPVGGEGSPLLVAGHLDTLGAMVRAIKPNGNLRITELGGYNLNAIENENVTVFTRSGGRITGTVQSTFASRHVWGEQHATPRTDETVEVVLDEIVASPEDVRKLGVRPGDMIAFDPRMVVTQSGFIKSRHLDDKAAVALMLALAKGIAEKDIIPGRQVTLFFSIFEEVGHGASTLFGLHGADFLAIDMGCVGDDLEGKETKVSICAKDRSGPYDPSFTQELIDRAERLQLDYAVDIYPRYGSDAGAARSAGMDGRFGLIGMGVFASHAYERTHVQGMTHTLKLLIDTVSHPNPS